MNSINLIIVNCIREFKPCRTFFNNTTFVEEYVGYAPVLSAPNLAGAHKRGTHPTKNLPMHGGCAPVLSAPNMAGAHKGGAHPAPQSPLQLPPGCLD